MSGLEIAASVATIIGIVPLCHQVFESFKNDLKRSSSNVLILPQPPLVPPPVVPSELLALEEAMGNIQLFLHRSKSTENKIRDLPKFVTQLRKAAYTAEDLLDELDYEHLQIKFPDALATGAAAVQPSADAESSSSSQVGCFAPLTMFFSECFAKPSPLQFPPPPHSSNKVTAERIRSTVEDLNRVASRLKDIYPLISESLLTTGSWKDKGSIMIITGPRVTTSTLNSSKIYGRDEKKKEIMDILKPDQIHGNEPRISINAIVGVGGVGKTTLAQCVFNDKKMKTLFHHKVWICVSDEIQKGKDHKGDYNGHCFFQRENKH